MGSKILSPSRKEKNAGSMCERGVEGNGDYEEAGCADGYDRKIGGYHTLASEKRGKT